MSDICKTTGHDCIKCNPGPCEHRAAEITKAEAIAHFKYGIAHDIFSEPVISYAKLAIEALTLTAVKECSTCLDKGCCAIFDNFNIDYCSDYRGKKNE